MAVSHSIFTLDGVVQLFWAAFDLPMTVLPLKVALGKEKFYFKQMDVAHAIFTLHGGFELFWAYFYLPMTVLPLKVALGMEKLNFWTLKK